MDANRRVGDSAAANDCRVSTDGINRTDIERDRNGAAIRFKLNVCCRLDLGEGNIKIRGSS